MALTKRGIDAAEYAGDGTSQDIRWDDMPGFGVRLYPSGAKTFVLKYRTSTGRTRLATVGKCGVLTLSQARDRARAMLVEVTDGKDPIEERQREKVLTLREYAPHYLEYVRLHNKSWKEDARRLGFRYVEGEGDEPGGFEPNKENPGRVLPTLGPRPLTEIRRKDIQDLHTKIGRRAKHEANRTVALLSAVLTRGLPEGMPNPASGVELFPEPPRKVYVKKDELPQLATAIEEEENVFIRAVVWLALLTSCRKSELLPRKWEDVDLGRRILRLPDTKSGRERIVPLSDPAMQILEDLPRFKDNPHVLPGSGPGSHLTKDGLKKPWQGIRERAGLEHITFHDLRRTFGSWSIQDGVPIAFISAALGHSSIRITERAYAHLSPDEPRMALERHGEQLLRVVEGNQS